MLRITQRWVSTLPSSTTTTLSSTASLLTRSTPIASASSIQLFTRLLSTHPSPIVEDVTTKNIKLRKLTELLARKHRMAEPASGDLASAPAVQIHRRMKGRMIRRARSQEFTSPGDGMSTGGMDIRLLRARSPRNADYYNRAHNPRRPLSIVPVDLQTIRQIRAPAEGTTNNFIQAFRKEVAVRRAPTTQTAVKGLPQTVLHQRNASQRTTFRYFQHRPSIIPELFEGVGRLLPQVVTRKRIARPKTARPTKRLAARTNKPRMQM